MPTPSSEENTVRLDKSELHLLNLLQRCLAFPWDHIVITPNFQNKKKSPKKINLFLKN